MQEKRRRLGLSRFSARGHAVVQDERAVGAGAARTHDGERQGVACMVWPDAHLFAHERRARRRFDQGAERPRCRSQQHDEKSGSIAHASMLREPP